jgi:ribonuclease HII
MQLELSWPESGLDAGEIAGVDEAGRGPWAGPVVAAAVILDPARVPDGIGDSKALRPALRRRLATEILACAQVGVGAASVAEIDRLNILAATMLAMARAVGRLPRAPRLALVDGNRAPDLPCEVRTLVKGDARHLAIGAASIVAKVTRDRLMTRLACVYPGYGWERNAGYGTAAHRRGLDALGVTAHHRRSFAPIRNALNPQTY